MKKALIVSVIILFGWQKLSAQETPKPKPDWAPGIYGGVSFGYGLFTHPFQKSALVTPYLAFANDGFLLNLDAGMAFSNRFGIRTLISVSSASNLIAQNEQTLAAKHPGYFVSYTPQIGDFDKSNIALIALGVSYAFPRKRWCFQPELLFGITEVHSDYVAVQLKQSGTHDAHNLDYIPLNSEQKSPTLLLGGRVSWHATRYIGFFAETRLVTSWHTLPYKLISKDLLEQTTTNETLEVKKMTYGATASLGAFLQIGRWKQKD